MNGIQAAHAETRGEITMTTEGKAVVIRTVAGRLVNKLWAGTSKDAAQQLRVFRLIALKHPETAQI